MVKDFQKCLVMMIKNHLLFADSPHLVTQKPFFSCNNFWRKAYSSLKLLTLTLAANFCITKSISCCLIRLHFYKQVSSLQYALLFQQSQMQTETAMGCPHIPACSLWEGKQRWILPQEIIQRCCCPPQCKLFIFGPELPAVLLFYTAVNYSDTAPAESPSYFVTEKGNLQ